MWNAVQYVTSGLTLVAFALAACVAIIPGPKRATAELIEKAPLEQRGPLVHKVLVQEDIDPARSLRNSSSNWPCRRLATEHNGIGRTPLSSVSWRR